MENREIKFRALDINGHLRYGSIICNNKNPVAIIQQRENPISNGVISGWCFAVKPETVSQYTGLKDKTGKEIYDGDIISVDVLVSNDGDVLGGDSDEPDFLKPPKKDYMFGVVEFHRASFMAVITGDNGGKAASEIDEDCIVLGNIYQNPELLKS